MKRWNQLPIAVLGVLLLLGNLLFAVAMAQRRTETEPIPLTEGEFKELCLF
ncbi:MAG: hypothetical protein ILP12_03585 [Lachnospiraceae bacterium]|nr:hypothetical protein [Lachnospiraceae bacterium]